MNGFSIHAIVQCDVSCQGIVNALLWFKGCYMSPSFAVFCPWNGAGTYISSDINNVDTCAILFEAFSAQARNKRYDLMLMRANRKQLPTNSCIHPVDDHGAIGG